MPTYIPPACNKPLGECTLLRIEILKNIFITLKHLTRVKCIATEIIASSLGNV